MKVRAIRRRAIARMGHAPFSHDREVMYHVRDVKPCKEYTPWCSDCNVTLFRRLFNRFPYSISEFYDFEDKQQAKAE